MRNPAFCIKGTDQLHGIRVVPELIRGGGWAPPDLFLNG